MDNENLPMMTGFTVPDHDAPFDEDIAQAESYTNLFPDGDERNNAEQSPVHGLPQERQQVQQPVSEPKKKGSSSNKRVSQLVHSNREKDIALAQANERIRLAEERIAQKDFEVEQYRQSLISTSQDNLSVREEQLLDGLRSAKETGDIDAEVKYQNALMDNKAAKGSLNSLADQPIRNDPAFSDEDTFIYPHDVSTSQNFDNYDQNDGFDDNDSYETAGPVNNFINRNPWFNKNPKLTQEAVVIAEELDNTLSFNGQDNLIGSDQYYAAIENTLATRYGLAQGDNSNRQQEQPRQSQQQRNVSYSDGVTTRGATMADQYIQRNPQQTGDSGSLTPEQIRMARNLQIPDPRRRGSVIDAGQAIKIAGQAARHHQRQDQSMFRQGGKYTISVPN